MGRHKNIDPAFAARMDWREGEAFDASRFDGEARAAYVAEARKILEEMREAS